MNLGLKGKIALVTGAASGLGLSLAEGLVREGVKVALTDSDGDGAVNAAAALKSLGDVIGFALDVSDDQAIDQGVARTVEAFGGVDILINNAGLTRGRWDALSDLSTQEWLWLFHVNVAALARLAAVCRPHMRARGGGVIVNQSSAAAYMTLDTSYSITKLAVSGLTVALSREFSKDNIRVNAMAPGMMTGRLPQDILEKVMNRQTVRRRGSPDDLVGTLLYLCSDMSSFVNGQTIIVDGGTNLRV